MHNQLVKLLYILLRDDVVPGRMEQIVKDIETHPLPGEFSNKFLQGYAEQLVGRLGR